MMIKKYYIDTSVFGGYFDAEFEDITKKLFEEILNGEIVILYSVMTESELVDAPEKIKDFVRSLPKQSIEYIEISEESIELADRYIAENVVG